MIFYIGLHQPRLAKYFLNAHAFISINVIRNRKSSFTVGKWIMDSGAFTEISKYGSYRHSVEEYADQIHKWHKIGACELAVAQDYMCEPFIIAKTGLSVAKHQELTIERYVKLCTYVDKELIMPVLQGYSIEEYINHLMLYDNLLRPGMRVGVGSVCKRNSAPQQVLEILTAIKSIRPDLLLHGFGLKITAFYYPEIIKHLYSADSMSWSFQARRNGDDANCPLVAKRFYNQVQLILSGGFDNLPAIDIDS